MHVRLSWKGVTAMSLLLPVLSATPACARRDGNDAGPDRAERNASRLFENAVLQQLGRGSAGGTSTGSAPNGRAHQSLNAFGIPRISLNSLNAAERAQHRAADRVIESFVVTPRRPQLQLDLSSADRNITLSSKFFRDQDWVTVNVGGVTKSFTEGQLVTAGEYIAIAQSAKSGSQSLTLNDNGVASSGDFSLNLLKQPQSFRGITSLVIPESVTAIDDVSKGALKISGDLINHGQILGVSNSRGQQGKVFADNIINLAGAVISMDSAVNQGNSSTGEILSSLVQLAAASREGTKLLLSATNSINNAGTIFSAGSLTLSAKDVRNSGVMFTGDSMLVETQKVVNSGVVQSLGAAMSLVAAGAVESFNVINDGGRLDAGNGHLYLTATTPINLVGGALNAKLVQFNSPNSAVNVAVDSINGLVDVIAFASAVHVKTGDLAISSIHVLDDPIFTNSSGNITLPATITASGAPVTAVAAGSIYGASGGTLIDTSSATGDGGEVILLAGVTNTTTSGITTVSGASGLGGSISGINGINASATGNGTGGAVTIGAYGGTITIDGSINANGRSGGIVSIFSPGNISLGDVSSIGAHDRVDYITIKTVDPSLAGVLKFDSTGKRTQGSIAAGTVYGTGSIVTGNLESGARGGNGFNSGNINVQATGDVTTGYLRAMGGGAPTKGWALQGYDYGSDGGHGGNINVVSMNGGLTVNGDINSSGGGGGGANHTVGGNGGDGGNILLTAIADVIINGPVIAPGGGGGGGVGISSTDTAGGGGSLGNGGGPNSGGLFYAPPPYDGPGMLDNGLNPHNPNRHRFPYAGMGGTNTAYDIGCCGSGYGGDVGNYGENGDEGTFAPRGWWNDTTPKKGGAPGLGGNITITGRDIEVTKTIQSAFSTKKDIDKSPYADISIFTHSQRGGGQIKLTTTGGNVASTVYAGASDLESNSPVISAQIRNGSVTIAGKMRGDQVKLNNQSLATTVAAGEIIGAGNGSITITVGGAEKTITNGDLVTASEWIALIQKGTTGSQSLQLSAGGAAADGLFGIASENIPTSGFSQLVVPVSVTASVSAPMLNATNTTLKGVMNISGQATSINASNLTLSGGITAPDAALTINAPQVNLASNSQITAKSLVINGAGSLNINLVAGATPGGANLTSNDITIGGAGQAISFSNASGGPADLNFNLGTIDIIGTTFLNSANTNLLFNGDETRVHLSGNSFTNNGTIKSFDLQRAGGSLSVESSSTSTFAFNGGNLSVTADGGVGDGGHLDISAPNAALTLAGGTLDASGTGNLDSATGGSISLAARSLNIVGGAPLVLRADGAQGGSGGSISVVTTEANSDLIADGAAGNLSLSARGGELDYHGGTTLYPYVANGGSVLLSAGRDVRLNASSIDVSGRGGLNNGGSVSITAGTAGSGNALFSGNLNVDGGYAGAGGKVSLSSNSTTPLQIGGATTNGVTGSISAVGNSGGEIALQNNGTGGIKISDSSLLSVNASGSDGGKLSLIAPSGNVDLASGDYRVDGANGSNAGGEISVVADSINIIGAGGANLSASGGSNGRGGLAEVIVNQDISLTSGTLTIAANGGSTGSSGGDGGTVRVHSGGDLTITSGSIDAGVKGNAGKGGRYELWAGTSPTSTGKLLVDGTLDVSGKGGASGGTISLEVDSSESFTIGGVGITNGVTGSLLATGGASGSDGAVSIESKGSEDLSIVVNSSINTGIGIASFASRGDLSVVVPGTFNSQFAGAGQSVNFDNQHGDAIVAGIISQGGEARITGDSIVVNGNVTGTGFAQLTSRSGIDLNANVSIGDASLQALNGSVNLNSKLTADGTVTIQSSDSLRIASNGFIDASVLSVLVGDGGIVSTTGASIASASRIDLWSTTGDIGGTSQLLVNASDSLSLATSGTGSVNVKNLSTGTLSLMDSSAGGSFTFVASGPLDVNDISTLDGDISVTTSSGNFYVMPGSAITAIGGNLKLRSDDVTGTFAVGANAAISASSTTAGEGNVFIGYGEQATKLAKPQKKYKNTLITALNGGGVYLSKGGLQTAKPTNTFTADGGKIVFQNGSKRKKSAVSIGGGVQISSSAPSVSVAVSFASMADASIMMQAGRASSTPDQAARGSSATMQTARGSSATMQAGRSFNAAIVAGSVASFSDRTVSISSASPPSSSYIDVGASSDQRLNLISTSPLRADTSYGANDILKLASTFVSEAEASYAPMEIGLWSHEPLVSEHANAPSVSSSSEKQLELRRGAVVFAPSVDTALELPGAKLKLAANSVALVVSTSDAVSIYDFDDRRKESVVLETNGERIALSPGQHVTIGSGTDVFGDLNPLEGIPHRALTVSKTKGGKSVFTSEFSVVAAMQGLKPISGVMSSKHKRSQQISSNLMKTAAVILQLRRSDDFQFHGKPQLAAWQR